MEFVEATKKKKVGISVKLREMEVSITTALFIDTDKPKSVVALAGRIGTETGHKYTTETTETGILVWRTA